MSVLLLFILLSELFEGVDVQNFVHDLSVVLYDMRRKGFDVLLPDMIKHFANGRVHHVVPSVVFDQGIDDWCEQVALHDVPKEKIF